MSTAAASPNPVDRDGPLTYTIVTRSHFHLAAALEAQFRDENPTGRFCIVVADADDPATGSPIWDWLAPVHQTWRAASGDDSGQKQRSLLSARQIIADDFWSLAFQYLPLELTCCLKGRVAAGWLARGERRLLYLDADTQIFTSSAACLSPLGSTGGILLTPHFRSPLPADGHYPNRVDLLRSGVFNAGVFGVAQAAESADEVAAFLAWWNACTARDCLVDPHNGLFVDQRWLDTAPALFPGLKISTHWGLNVGYWNLHDRELHQTPQGIQVRPQRSELNLPRPGDESAVQPLQVFHFSGAERVDGEGRSAQHRLSRHQNRHTLNSQPVVARLLHAYLDAWDRHAWRHYAGIPFAYAHLPGGIPVPLAWREAYRQNLCGVRDLGANPFAVFDEPSGRARMRKATQPESLKSGRFQFHLEGLQARLARLQRRLDREPWRRLVRVTRHWKNQWLKRT
jgi:hypothetical protein